MVSKTERICKSLKNLRIVSEEANNTISDVVLVSKKNESGFYVHSVNIYNSDYDEIKSIPCGHDKEQAVQVRDKYLDRVGKNLVEE